MASNDQSSIAELLDMVQRLSPDHAALIEALVIRMVKMNDRTLEETRAYMAGFAEGWYAKSGRDAGPVTKLFLQRRRSVT